LPKILTQAEYEALSSKNDKIGIMQAPESPQEILPPAPAKPIIKRQIEYLFFHPDNSDGYKISGKFLVEYKEKIIEIPIENGILKTDNEDIKNILISKGMIFTHEKEVKKNGL
jgi:hypothetical protein